MKKNIATTFLLLFGWLALFGQKGDKANNRMAVEIREVSGFSGIQNRCSADVLVSQGSNFEVKVEADDHIISKILTEVKGDNLVISVQGNIYRAKVMRVHVTLPAVKALNVYGSGNITSMNNLKSGDFSASIHGSGDMDLDLTVSNFEGRINGSGDMKIRGIKGRLDISVNGSGDFDAKGLQLTHAHVSNNGSGDIRLNGKADELIIKSASSGDIHARELTASKVTAESRGSGNLSVWAVTEANLSTYGSGDIYLRGTPPARKVTSRGSGSIIDRD